MPNSTAALQRLPQGVNSAQRSMLPIRNHLAVAIGLIVPIMPQIERMGSVRQIFGTYAVDPAFLRPR